MSLNSLLVTLVRHGESLDNQQGLWAGFRDTALTTNGVNQARSLGQAFANVSLTAIYSSDLKRAAMTADEILKANRSIPPPPLVQSKSLREQNFGQGEGQTYASAEWARASSGQDARTFRFPEGESLQEVNARIAKAVRQFVVPRVEALRKKQASSSGTHICIVAHGIAIAELLRVFMALHNDSEASPWSDPLSTYKRVRLENTAWSRLELAVPADNDHSSAPSSDVSIDASTAGIARETSPEAHARSSPAIKPIYVRILCQNQTEHLRAAGLQASSALSSNATSHHLGGGGIDAPISSSNPSGSAAGSPAAASKGLPSSATLTSIASNATASTSKSTAMAPPSSTPVHARAYGATPASVRSFNSYDLKNMTRELERAGAASVLVASEAVTGNVPSTSSATASSTALPDRHGTTTPSSVSHKLSNLDRNAYTPSPAASISYPASSYSGPSVGTTNTASPVLYGIGTANAPSFSSDVWQMICVRVLPLFNGERLRTSIEELNETVSLHVRKTLERSQARAIESLTLDLTSLVSSGTLTLNSKLHGLSDSRHLVRLVEIWTFYLTQVLPYVEGCFVPLQTDAALQSLSSSTSLLSARPGAALSMPPAPSTDHKRIDVRRILLSGFRDEVVLPIYERLFYLFAHIADLEPALSAAESTLSGRNDATKQIYFRLLQMVSVLASIQSEDDNQVGIDGLLRALRMGSKSASASRHRSTVNGLGVRTGSPGQRSSNRRGWMAQKAKKHGINTTADTELFGVPDAAVTSSDGRTLKSVNTNVQPLASFKPDSLGQLGLQLSEDEYLTSLQSPADSPAISTPIPQDPASTPQPRENGWTTLHDLSDNDFCTPPIPFASASHAIPGGLETSPR